MSLEICGIGTAVPEHSLQQADAAELAMSLCAANAQQQRWLSRLYRQAGVRKRHSVLLSAGRPQPQADPDRARVRAAEVENPTANTTAPPPDHVARAIHQWGRPAAQVQAAASVTQRFYEPPMHADDCGPTTAERMEVYERCAGGLACRAAAAALRQARLAPGEITHVVTVSCTGFAAPGVDVQLIGTLGISPQAARTQVGFMGCHGALNALRVAQALVSADPHARVLICAVELCSLHQQYGWNPQCLVANALFADGAAALVGRSAAVNGEGCWRVVASGTTLIEGTVELMGWRIRDHGFEMTLSPQVPGVIRSALRPWLAAWLGEYGVHIGEIGSWAIHPGGPGILSACGEALGLGERELAPSREILADFGNLSSASVLFILERLMYRQAPRPCVMLAFGPGLSVEAALVADG